MPHTAPGEYYPEQHESDHASHDLGPVEPGRGLVGGGDEAQHDGKHHCRKTDEPDQRAGRGSLTAQPQVGREQVNVGNEEENDGGLREHEIGILDGRAHEARDHERRRDPALDQQADVWRLPARMDPPERRRQRAIDARDVGQPRRAGDHAPTPPRLPSTSRIATIAASGASQPGAPSRCTRAAVACGMPLVMLTVSRGSATSIAAVPNTYMATMATPDTRTPRRSVAAAS